MGVPLLSALHHLAAVAPPAEGGVRLDREPVERHVRRTERQRAGEVVTAHGELRTVTFRPQSESRALEAVLYDGSGSLTLVWLGRKRVPGIEVGRVLTATGPVITGASPLPGSKSVTNSLAMTRRPASASRAAR